MEKINPIDLAPPGWRPLLRELDSELKKTWPTYNIWQVVEKSGALRLYADPGMDSPKISDRLDDIAAYTLWYSENAAPFYELIHEYEERSYEICRTCGESGRLGRLEALLSTYCEACEPEGWKPLDLQCAHPSIHEDRCADCGMERIARLEHSEEILYNVHARQYCLGEWCTIHNRSNHSMRAFPQHFRGDRMLMERICEHGVGHPDPDDIKLQGSMGSAEAVHGCDGCCSQQDW